MKKWLLYFAAALIAVGCDIAGIGPSDVPVVSEYDRVAIIYSPGYNTISEYLKGDVREILNSPSEWLPIRGGKKALLVFSHNTAKAYDFATPTSPYLFRIMRDYDGSVICDTLLTLEAGTRIVDPEVARDVMEYIGEKFPSKHYGMLFSSHGTGWLPKGYYGTQQSEQNVLWSYGHRRQGIQPPPGAVPYIMPDPDDIPVKSIGNELEQGAGGKNWSYEMDIPEFLTACPLHFDYLLLDCCLMGGIETAYEFRKIADYIGFSAAEIPAEGFYYTNLSQHLLYETPANPMAVCSDFYQMALQRSGSQRTAVISYIDCSKLEAFALVSARIFEKYRTEINSVNPSDVQGFFRHNQHFFYDMLDIVEKAGVQGEDYDQFVTALNDCVLYRAHTEKVMTTVTVRRFCGFSMFLPCNGNDLLRDFYKGLAWNKATALVK
jgi:hypothetical protein